MEQIIEYLQQTYAPLGVIVYGSYADGSKNEHSDFDVLVIIQSGVESHDNTIVDGVMLDAYIYPKEKICGEINCEDFIQIFDGRIVLDTDGIAAALQSKVRAYIDNVRPKTYAENKTNVEWCEKMLLRAARGDAEGYFRWHWLLTESLEVYCDLLGERYLGPKKSIKRMQAERPADAKVYEKALAKLDYAALTEWIHHLKTLLK